MNGILGNNACYRQNHLFGFVTTVTKLDNSAIVASCIQSLKICYKSVKLMYFSKY